MLLLVTLVARCGGKGTVAVGSLGVKANQASIRGFKALTVLVFLVCESTPSHPPELSDDRDTPPASARLLCAHPSPDPNC